jgi:Zn-dependent protease with chaperone function
MPNEPTPPAGTSRPSKPKPAATKPSTSPAASAPAPAAATRRPAVTGTELATAFNGKLEPRRLSIGYHVSLFAITLMMVVLPLVYFGIIAGTGWLTMYHATHSLAMFDHVRGRGAILIGVVYIAPIIAGALLILSMLAPLFWRSRRGPKPFWVSRSEQPLLYAYVENLCDAMRAPRPARIDIVASATASAHIDNGLFGLIRRKLVLTIGLPLPATMSLREFTGVLAHELGHFTQGSSMRLSYAIHIINGWFGRMGYGRSGVDEMIDGMLSASDAHWALLLIGGLCKLVVGTAKLVLKALALLSHALSMGQSRAAEFDADYQAARIVGSKALGDALQGLPATDLAFSSAIERAQAGWSRKTLPDDLVLYTHAIYRQLTPEMREKTANAALTAETSWFDTHPPLFVRVGALMKAKLIGVLKIDAPATVIFKDFDELSKMATIDLYQNVLGSTLQPEHLVPTPSVVTKPK